MTCFAVQFIIYRYPDMIHYIDKIEAYDMGEATTLFFGIMLTKLNFKRSDFCIKDILEMK